MLVVRTIEELMDAREARLRGGSDSQTYLGERGFVSMMQPNIKAGRKLGNRPCSNQGTLNQRIISLSPGSSRSTGLDFVKAVYADKTGQEQEDWSRQF